MMERNEIDAAYTVSFEMEEAASFSCSSGQRGNVTKNVEPFPSSDSNQIRPPLPLHQPEKEYADLLDPRVAQPHCAIRGSRKATLL